MSRREAKVRECSERQVRRTRPKVIASCRAREWGVRTRGRRPRILTTRDNVQLRSPSAKCCELYSSLHDRFRLEVRILFYPMRTWKLAAWVTLIIAGMRLVGGRGEGVQVEAGAVAEAQPRWGPGAKPRRGVRPDCHETILKCLMNKFCHEMRHDLWR